jgi:hypothetical protein
MKFNWLEILGRSMDVPVPPLISAKFYFAPELSF